MSMEVHVMNKLEAKLKAIGDMSEAQYEAAKELMAGHAGPQVVVNTAIVDERIDKRFEDMEAMLREARDEGRAEVFTELDGLGRRSGSDTDAIERGLREGMEKGVLKGIEMGERAKAAGEHQVPHQSRPGVENLLGKEKGRGAAAGGSQGGDQEQRVFVPPGEDDARASKASLSRAPSYSS